MLALLLAICVVVPTGAQQAADAPVIVRMTIRPETGAVVGQRIEVLVDVLFRDGMVRPPRVTVADIPGAQLVRFETQATTMTDRVGGQDYTGQRFEFALYARRGGSFTVPAPVATLLDASGEAIGTVTGQPATVDVAVPPGADASRPIIATTRTTLRESWSPPNRTSFKAGDAVVRTIVREVSDVSGMAIPDLSFSAPAGVRVYAGRPDVTDAQSRGEVTGRRTDTVTYVFETGGTFDLPAVTQPWWNLTDKRLQTERGAGLSATVAAASPAPASFQDLFERWGFIATTALGSLALAFWGWWWLRERLAERRARWLASERKARADLLAACRRVEPRAIYEAYVVWRARMRRSADLASLAETIEAVLFAGASWSAEDARAFAGRVEAVAGAAPQRRRAVSLPPLNPEPAGR
jgi:hypothetical protein